MSGSRFGLSKRQYELIGKVAAEWATLEWMLQCGVWDIAGMDPGTGMKITSDLRSPVIFNMLLALAHDSDKDERSQPPIYWAFYNIGPTLVELRGERNRIVHQDWLRQSQSEIVGFHHEAKGKLKAKIITRNVSDMEGTISRIRNLTAKVVEILEHHKHGQLVASPPTPPKRPQAGPRTRNTGLALGRPHRPSEK